MRVKISSLGCRLNISEIESVSTALKLRGHTIVSEDTADVYIINSCTVTSAAEASSRKLWNKARKSISSNAIVIVTGCASGLDRYQDGIYFVSNDYKHFIPDLIENIEIDYVNSTNASRFNYLAPYMSSTTRANLKIQDGCNNFCSFCYIPFVRGNTQSKPIDDIVNDFQKLIDANFIEIVLTGIQIANYNDNGLKLVDLLKKLLSLDGNFRLHLSSILPSAVSNELIDLFDNDKLVKHLSMSLQSGSEKILKLMNRNYSAKYYIDTVNKIKLKYPLFNFTTDLIVGFPKETDSDFNDSLEVMKDAGFSQTHIFRYSQRPQTKAATLEGQISETIKKERAQKAGVKLNFKKRILHKI